MRLAARGATVATVLVCLGLPGRAEASPSHKQFFTLSASSSRIAMTVKIAKRKYAANSLIEAHFKLTNSGRTPVCVLAAFQEENPSIEVSSSGRVLYPPAMYILPALRGGLGHPPGCGSGLIQRVSGVYTQYAILKGPTLQPRMELEYMTGASRGVPWTLTTAPLSLRLGSEARVTGTIRQDAAGIRADFNKPRGAHGAMVFDAQVVCPPGVGSGSHGPSGWLKSNVSTLRPSCPDPSAWVVIAGWVGFPVAEVSYSHS